MANETNFIAVRLLSLAACALIAAIVPVNASADSTKTVDLDIKPGGVVETFTKEISDYKCSFTYASQGGTNEHWMMSVGLSDDDRMFSCSVWRPSGRSYLFFTQFKVELKGAKVEYANAYSQTSDSGQGEKELKPEEFVVGDTTVTHNAAKFNAQLAKVTVIGRTRHDEL
ncbi:myeloid-derived growth factor [Nelusetta ayraudi]|uniref:myeloid-derived growth factor n=1 Tax=Nelusetta ayraudi TaxID=303726 RepID=UPI003F723891